MIRETILTTCSAAGTAHIAPLGMIEAQGRDAGLWIVAPFSPSTTLANLAATGTAIANYSDDALIFAGCLTGRRDWPLEPVVGHPVPRLAGALAHSVLTVERLEDDPVRPRFFCRLGPAVTHAPYLGMNRAKAAVLEMAILVSRLSMLPRNKVDAEIAYLQIAIDKTAGPDETLAWQWLIEKVASHYGKTEAI